MHNSLYKQSKQHPASVPPDRGAGLPGQTANNMQQQTDTTATRQQSALDIAKALHYIVFSKAYFEYILQHPEVSPKSAQALRGYVGKLNWITNDVLTSMPSASADLLRAELQKRDVAGVDSILNMCICLEEPQRLELEQYIIDKYFKKG